VRAFDIKGTLQMLKHRRGDAVFDWGLRLIHNLPEANMKRDEIRFQDASGIIPTRDMYFAYSPNWPESFKQFVHHRLKLLKADGTLDGILRKYGG
jgi:ABC-type amino acid transport substrate-binding protein